MVHPLYWISTLVFATALAIILVYDIRTNKKPEEVEYKFRKLIIWVIVFLLQDAVWGIAAGEAVMNDTFLMVSSTVFHASTVITTYFWLNYVLTYIGDKIHNHSIYYAIDGVLIAAQMILLVANWFIPIIFYVGYDGSYCTAFLRSIAFWNQYIIYFILGMVTLLTAISEKGESRYRFFSVVCFVSAPILSGVFQYLYPDAPFHSIGYFLGCCMIYSFVVSRDRESLQQLYHQKYKIENEMKMAEQIAISYTDELTGLYNRRAYEDELKLFPNVPEEDAFVYVSADVNGLKITNDNLGHLAGDELLKGAAACLKRCLGPYGRVFRIGGDEFAAIIYADEAKVDFIKNDLLEVMACWKGELVKELSFSVGFVLKKDFPGMTVNEIAKIADERMYKQKAAYYMNKGVDRRGQRSAYDAICASYMKILQANLSDDSYKIISMDKESLNADTSISDKLSEWLYNFGVSGQVHKDDLNEYLKNTNLEYLKEYFKGDKKSIHIFYNRKMGDVYRYAMMEMIKASDYRDEQQMVYLYVKDIDVVAGE